METDHGDDTRRAFLRGAAGLGTATLIPRIGWAAAGGAATIWRRPGCRTGSFWLLGLTEAGAETFRLPLPDRGHAAAAHPQRPEAVAFARRPGTFALVIDCAEGREVARLHSPEDRHFYGHGAFTPDGRLLFTTENAIAEGTGRLGIWDARRRLPADRRGAVGRQRPARGAADAGRRAASRWRTAASRPTRPRGGPS